jgi:hypothetical protein
VSPYNALFRIQHTTVGDVKESDLHLFLISRAGRCVPRAIELSLE